jgi:hypothetical protein
LVRLSIPRKISPKEPCPTTATILRVGFIRADERKQKAKISDHRAESREQRAESREQEAVSRKQRAESRQEEAGCEVGDRRMASLCNNRQERLSALCSLLSALCSLLSALCSLLLCRSPSIQSVPFSALSRGDVGEVLDACRVRKWVVLFSLLPILSFTSQCIPTYTGFCRRVGVGTGGRAPSYDHNNTCMLDSLSLSKQARRCR